jgi:hypothetical protein
LTSYRPVSFLRRSLLHGVSGQFGELKDEAVDIQLIVMSWYSEGLKEITKTFRIVGVADKIRI